MEQSEKDKILQEFYNKLFYGQKDIPAEYKKVINDNWDELLNS